MLSYEKTEILINFNQNSINRFCTCHDPKVYFHITSTLGIPDACAILESSTDRKETLKSIYLNQLKTCANYVKYFEMKNAKNMTIYYLFFATNNPLGFIKMKEAFWQVNKETGDYFSDATNPNQMVLFNGDPTNDVASLLQSKFNGKQVDVSEIYSFINENTDYLEKHARKSLIKLEIAKLIDVNEVKVDGNNRKKGSFPLGTLVNFN